MSVIDLAILGVLSDEELHGYELTKRLTDVLRPASAVSFGSVYPALSRLERRGLVKAVEAARQRAEPIPMTGSLAGELAAARSLVERAPKAGRARKVYGITAAGEAQLIELLVDPSGTATSAAFDLRLALFHHLSPTQRLALIEGRTTILEARRHDVRRGPRPVDRHQLARQVRELGVIAHDLAWLADLARAEIDEMAHMAHENTAHEYTAHENAAHPHETAEPAPNTWKGNQ